MSFLLFQSSVHSDEGVVCYFQCRDVYCDDLNNWTITIWPPVNYVITAAVNKFEGCLEMCPPVKKADITLGTNWDPKHFVNEFRFKCGGKMTICGKNCGQQALVILGGTLFLFITAIVVLRQFT